MKFIKTTLTDGSIIHVNTFDIVLVLQYTGRVNTFKNEKNEDFGAEMPFKTVAGDPLFVTNGAILSIRNKSDLVVKESHQEVMDLIADKNPVEPI